MLYESYERKILKIVRIKNSIIRHRVSIIIFASLILAILSVFLFFKGSITKDIDEIKNITYGENIDVSYSVFCGKGYLEYKTEDGEWMTEKPIYPGNYSVRLVSSRTFGIKSSGKILTFTIDKKEITTALGNTQIVYGENANLIGSLCYGDKISSFDAVFESSEVGSTSLKIDKGSIKAVDSNGNDVSFVYNFSGIDTTVSIIKRRITITTSDISKVYDGTNEITAEYETTSGGYSLVDGHKIEAECKLTSNSVGTCKTQITSYKIINADGTDVSDNYSITTKFGNATITQRPITIYPQNVSKIYDGTRLSTSTGLIHGESVNKLVDGHSISVECESNDENVGTHENTITDYTITDASGKEVTKNYSATLKTGTITITKRAITIYPETTEKIYDGTNSIEAEGLTKGGTKLSDSHTLEIECELDGADVGTHKSTINSYTIKDANGKVVTDNYKVTTETGTSIIKQRPITIKPKDTTKVYDGTNEITAEYETTSVGYSLVDGHKIVATCELTSVDAGDSNTEITSCEIYTAENVKVTANYAISTQQGDVKIMPRPIIIYPQDVSKIYDGTKLSKLTGLIQTGTEYGLVLDHTISVECESNDENVGTHENTIKTYTITDGNGNDVTKNYSVTKETGKIKITQKPITVKSKDASKDYDGTPLTSIDYEITSGYLIEGQTIKITTDGSITDVEMYATYNNITAVKITSGNDDVTKNYVITTQGGTLKITPREITIVAASDTKVYDKTPLTCDTYTVENLVSGHELDKTCVKIDGTITRAGETENIVTIDNDKFVVTDQNGTVKTHNYTYATQYGKLTVTPRPLTVRLSGITKVYSGKAVDLTNISYWLPKQDANSGLVGDDKIQSVTNIYAIDSNNKKTSVINVGTYTTTGTVTIIDTKGDDFTDCYDINCYGTVTITAFVMQCTVDNTENETFTFSELRFFRSAEMPAGHKISCDTEESLSITELLKHIKVTDTVTNSDVTSNYKFEYEKTQT